MVLTRKKKHKQLPSLKMSGTSPQEVHSHTHLGVTIAKNLSWNEHIESLAVKAGQCLDVPTVNLQIFAAVLLSIYSLMRQIR